VPLNSQYLKFAAVLVIVTVLPGVLYGAYRPGKSVADARWQVRWADQQTLQAKRQPATTAENKAEEQRRQTAVNQVGNEARQQQTIETTDSAAASVPGQRVREQAGKLAASSGCSTFDSGATERGKTTTRAAMVLSDLFQRADKGAGELAKAYHAARITGMACEASYIGLELPIN
jgi:hypothetical protein